MDFKKQSNLKINDFSNTNNQSKALEVLTKINYGKMLIGLSGLSVCIPYLLPFASTNQILSLIPIISSKMVSLGFISLGSISAYTIIDIISEILNDKNLEHQKYSIKETKKGTTRELNVNDLVSNSNKQLLESCISKDKF